MKKSGEASRLRALEYLKKFRDQRRHDGRNAGKSDLQILRRRMAPFFLHPFYLVMMLLLVGWMKWEPMPYLVSLVAVIALSIFVMLHNRKIRAVVGLFEECAPQSVPEMLGKLDGRVPESNSFAVAFIEKFSEDRRKFDAYSPLSDFQALRNLEGISIFPVVVWIAVMWNNHFPNWIVALATILLLVGYVYTFRLQRKVKTGLAMFDECTPQNADEVLAQLQDDGGNEHAPALIVPSV